MARSRKIIKVFIASPGDLQEERQAAKHVVDQFNKQWADYLSTHVELVGWEDTVSRFGRPQDLINQDSDQCEVFIGIMWKQWGSPPSNNGPYSSGFEEEFERAVASRKRSDRPEISLLFKEIEPEFLKDPGDGLRKVEAFKNKIIVEKTILFQRFANISEFEDKIRDCVTSYIQSLQAEETQRIADETTGKASDTSGGMEKSKTPAYSPLSVEGAQFLREFVTKTEREGAADTITPAEVARFRLLSSMVGVHGNDSDTLGVHDTNILFFNRDEIVLSLREMLGLVVSGLAHISNENVPLWHWYVAADCEESGYLSFVSCFGQPSRRIGALNAMRLISEPIKPPPLNMERTDVVRSWFQESADDLKVAALEYLAVCGTAEDLPLIRTEYDRGNYRTVGPATDAILRLTLKDSRDAALRALNELQPERVDAGLIGVLFSKPDTLETSWLIAAATHRSSTVRNAVVPILVSRQALPPEIAEQLLSDPDASVRFYSLRSLIDAGRDYPDEKAKNILVKPSGSLGLGGLLSAGVGRTVPDKQGESFYKTFRTERLRGLSEGALERIIASESIFDRDARFARDFKKFSERGTALRAAIDDKFKSLVSSDIKELEGKLGADADTIKRLYSLEETLRKQFCRQALDIICEKSQAQDLARVRTAIREGFVDYSPRDVEYLRNHGEWQDVKLLISLVERHEQSSPLLMGADETVVKALSSALIVLAKGRLAELIKLKMPYRLLETIIKRSADKEIATLSDDELMPLMTSELDVIRKATSLKAIRSLSKRRIKVLLRRYIEHDGQRYYNVIYWLDFGISLPKTRVLRATHSEMTKN